MSGLKSKRVLALGLAGCAAAIIIVGWLSSHRSFETLDNLTYDAMLRVRASRPAVRIPRDIMLVTIDEESVGVLNERWPWPRSCQAKLVRRLTDAGARAIGIDILFSEKTSPGEDRSLAVALAAAKNVILAAKLDVIKRKEASSGAALSGRRLVLPLPLFRRVAKYGIVNLPFDSDHVVRRFRPAFTFQDRTFPAFAAAVYQAAALGSSPILHSEQELGIDYLGAAGTFETVPAYQVLNGTAGPELFRDRIVLVGATLSDLHDRFATPLSKGNRLSSGLEIQANVLSSIIRDRTTRPLARSLQVLLAILVALIAGYFAIFRSGIPIIVLYTMMALIVLVGSFLAMRSLGIYLDISYPLLAMPISYILAGIPLRQRIILNTKIGPYRLLGELGRGNMAVVYRARHPKTHDVVALKQMLPQYAADGRALKRFLREVELIRQTNHPNIVRIVDAGEIAGQPYYAMEFIRGRNLEEVLAEEYRCSGTDTRRIGGAIARALAQAHKVGVVHRDIKPSNIMLTGTGMPKLTDFGIACKTDAPHLTQAGALLGTPNYMSPEQCRGEEVTPASDIYSLGATLYHLLVGQPPFAGEEVSEIIQKHINEEPTDIRAINNSIDLELARLVMRCIAKDPKDRPPDMMTVAIALEPYYSSTEDDGYSSFQRSDMAGADNKTVVLPSHNPPDAPE